MPGHSEVSIITTLGVVADYALFSSEIAYPRIRRSIRRPISVREQSDSIVAISQIMISLEGYINRILFLLGQRDSRYEQIMRNEDPAMKLESIIANMRGQAGIILFFKEALVMRNAIMHAHVYQTERNVNREIFNIEKKILSENRRYRDHVNERNYRTNKHLLHVVPSEIGFDDVLKSLKLWNKIYESILRKHGSSVAYLSPYYPYNFRRFMTANQKGNEFEVIPFDNDGSFKELIRYFDNMRFYKEMA